MRICLWSISILAIFRRPNCITSEFWGAISSVKIVRQKWQTNCMQIISANTCLTSSVSLKIRSQNHQKTTGNLLVAKIIVKNSWQILVKSVFLSKELPKVKTRRSLNKMMPIEERCSSWDWQMIRGQQSRKWRSMGTFMIRILQRRALAEFDRPKAWIWPKSKWSWIGGRLAGISLCTLLKSKSRSGVGTSQQSWEARFSWKGNRRGKRKTRKDQVVVLLLRQNWNRWKSWSGLNKKQPLWKDLELISQRLDQIRSFTLT